MNLNTTGSFNCAFGSGALASNTTSNTNSAFGIASLALSTGGSNIGLGYNSGASITTGANNIVIGTNAQASSATVSNEITIGNSTNTVIRMPLNYGAVASLPSASTVGRGTRTFVTDALAPAFGVTVAGTGAVFTPVYSDGTNWKVG
jgi:hypothetical protein